MPLQKELLLEICSKVALKKANGKNSVQTNKKKKKRKAPGRLFNVFNKTLCSVSTFFGSKTFNRKEIGPIKRKLSIFLTPNQKGRLGGCCRFPTGATSETDASQVGPKPTEEKDKGGRRLC